MEWLPSGWKFIVPLKVVSWSLFFHIYYCIKSFRNGIVEYVPNWFYLNSRVGILFFWGRWMPRQQCFWVRRAQFSESPWVRFLPAHMKEKAKLFTRPLLCVASTAKQRKATQFSVPLLVWGCSFTVTVRKGQSMGGTEVFVWPKLGGPDRVSPNKYNCWYTSVAKSTITEGHGSLDWKATA